MNTLITELKKEAYTGLTASEALALLPAQVTKIGRIQEYNKLDLITLVITNDITERLANAMNSTDDQLGMAETPELAAQYRGLAKIIGKALDIDLIKADIYRINLGLTNIRAMFDGALSFGLLTDDEHAAMLKLAEYKEGVDFSGYNLSDVDRAKLALTPKTIEATYIDGEFVNKTSDNVITLDVTAALSYDDIFTVTAASTNDKENEFVHDSNSRCFFHVPAGFTGKLRKKINTSGLDIQCKFFVISKFNRDFACTATSVG